MEWIPTAYDKIVPPTGEYLQIKDEDGNTAVAVVHENNCIWGITWGIVQTIAPSTEIGQVTHWRYIEPDTNDIE